MIKNIGFIVLFLIQVGCTSKKNDIIVSVKDPNVQLYNGDLFYKDNLFSGTIVDHYTSHQLKSKALYQKGRKEGTEELFYQEGQLKTYREYTGGIKTGIHKGWWPNSAPMFEYQFDEKGRYDGYVKEWYSNGQLLKTFNYSDGKEDGRQQMFRSNGAIRANYQVINGERFGLIGLKKCYTIKKDSTKIYKQ